MGDSETECSDVLSECNSPILYTGAPSGSTFPVVRQPAEPTVKPVETQTAFVSQFENESQFPFPETQAYQESVGALDALAGLDSMLANPSALVTRTPIVQAKTTPSKQITRTPSAVQTSTKVRTLDHILKKIPKQNVNRFSLSAQLDSTDMKLLIHACGEVVPYKTSKGTICEKLLHLIEHGTLDKVFHSVRSIGAQSNSAPAPDAILPQVPPAPQETSFDTRIETQPPQRSSSPRSLQRSTSVRSDTQGGQPSSSRAVLVAEADLSLWAPVTDVALLNQLRGAEGGERAAPPKVDFLPDKLSPGVFFAQQPADAWQACDEDTQRALQDRDPTHEFRHMLHRLSQSRAGISSEFSLAATSAPLVSPTEEVRRGSELEHHALLDSLRNALSRTAPSLEPPRDVAPPSISKEGGGRGGGEETLSYDSLKLAVFRQDKLGLSLIRQVGPSGVERVVVQAKSRGALDPALDRLLSVGDELVTVHGRPIGTLGGEGGGGCGGGGVDFAAVMEHLRQAPRPLQLGFIPAGTQRAVVL